MSQPRPHATFCTDVYAASIELIAARHLFRNNAHLPVPSLEIIVVLKVMIPHYFHKQQHVVCPQKYLCVLHINHGWMQLVLNRCACISDDYYFILAPLPQAPPGGEPCIIHICIYTDCTNWCPRYNASELVRHGRRQHDPTPTYSGMLTLRVWRMLNTPNVIMGLVAISRVQSQKGVKKP